MNRNDKDLYTILNYIEHFLILASTITAFACLIGSSIGITSSAIRLNICAITGGIKKYKTIIKKNKIKRSIK